MRKRMLRWFGIIISTSIVALAILYLIEGSFVAVIGIPIGIYMIIRFLPDTKERMKHEDQTN